MNLSKPGKEIFIEAAREGGLVPEETLFIDDGAANVETAKGLGFKVLLFDVQKDMESQVQPVLDADAMECELVVKGNPHD
jgi:putative hydrolase of the HAD superfamily